MGRSNLISDLPTLPIGAQVTEPQDKTEKDNVCLWLNIWHLLNIRFQKLCRLRGLGSQVLTISQEVKCQCVIRLILSRLSFDTFE